MYRRYPAAVFLFVLVYGAALVAETGTTLDLTWQAFKALSDFTGVLVSELASSGEDVSA